MSHRIGCAASTMNAGERSGVAYGIGAGDLGQGLPCLTRGRSLPDLVRSELQLAPKSDTPGLSSLPALTRASPDQLPLNPAKLASTVSMSRP